MSQVTYFPRIPTSRKVLPSQYQRLLRKRRIIVNFAISTTEFMDSMQRAADSMARFMKIVTTDDW